MPDTPPPVPHDFGSHFCKDTTGCTLCVNGVAPKLQQCKDADCVRLLFKIRKSHIESYAFCPMQFYWTFIAGKQGGVNHDIWKPPQHMLVGTRFHEFATKFFDYYQMVPETMDDWESMIPEEFNDAEREMAGWWLGYQLMRLRELRAHGREDEWMPIAREQQMDNPEFGLTSTVDCVEWLDKDTNADGTVNWDVGKKTRQVCIVEYKTGRKMSIDSAVRQCTFYALLWSMNGNVGKVTHVKLVNPRLQAYAVYKITDDDIKNVIRSIVRLRHIIKDGVYRQNCSDGKYAACRMCDIHTLKIFPEDAGSWKDHPFSSYPVVDP